MKKISISRIKAICSSMGLTEYCFSTSAQQRENTSPICVYVGFNEIDTFLPDTIVLRSCFGAISFNGVKDIFIRDKDQRTGGVIIKIICESFRGEITYIIIAK